MSKCLICGTDGGYEGFREFDCINPFCQNWAGVDRALELIGDPEEILGIDTDESEFEECVTTRKIVHNWGRPRAIHGSAVPTDNGWIFPAGDDDA